jgi:hypothetical protein
MADLAIYEQASMAVNGKLLAECADVSWQYVDTDSVVHILGSYYGTLDSGLTATSPGARWVEASFTNLISVEGVEHDFIKDYLTGALVNVALTFFGSGSKVVSSGRFRNPQFKTAVGSNLLHSVSFLGLAARWQF